MALSNLSYITNAIGDRSGKFIYWEVIVAATSSGAAESITLASLPVVPTATAIIDSGGFHGINTPGVDAVIATNLQSVGGTLLAQSYRITIRCK